MDSYYPFSTGKHSCIGIKYVSYFTKSDILLILYSFAWAEMRMIAANIYSRFDVTEVSGQAVDFRQFITIQFASGHWQAILTQRSKTSKGDKVGEEI
jgi:hypothetical protein